MRDLVTVGLENGVNLYEAPAHDVAAAEAIAQASSSLERNLIMVGLRLKIGHRDLSRTGMVETIRAVLARSGLRWIDYILVEEPKTGEIGEDFFNVIEAARGARRLRFIGLSGESEAVDDLIKTGRFHVFSSSYNLCSNWSVRNRLRLAQSHQMAVVGHNPAPTWVTGEKAKRSAEPAQEKRAGGLLGALFSRPPEEEQREADAYAFLHHIRGWTAEGLCLGYALTEPALASFLTAPVRPDQITALAPLTEREMPNGVPAQIEMARVSIGAG
jgi:aryl-alcohol dehydrogenase-like predicted oxidoreductase